MHRWAVACAKVLPFPLLLPLLPLPIAIWFLGNQDSISQSINQLVSTHKTHLSMRETHHVGSVKLLAWLLQFCSGHRFDDCIDCIRIAFGRLERVAWICLAGLALASLFVDHRNHKTCETGISLTSSSQLVGLENGHPKLETRGLRPRELRASGAGWLPE